MLQVRLWRGTRSPQDIKETWQRQLNPLERKGRELLLYWDFNMPSGEEYPHDAGAVIDRSGNSRVGHLQGGMGAYWAGEVFLRPTVTPFVPLPLVGAS